jgi:hypothetical protein
MRTLRFLGSSHPSVYAILILVASVHSAYGQTATLSTVRNFGSVGMGSTSAASTVTLRNGSTTVALLVTNIAVTGDFAQTNNCGSSVPARGSCVITLTFTPTATGARTGTLTVTDNATPSTQTAALNGTGVAPATITPASRAFGNVAIGSTSVARTFTVANSGSAAMAFSVSHSANFTETDNCASVAAHGSCTINAAFAPTAAGAVNGTIGVSYSGTGSPLSVAVTGTGIAPVSVTPASRAFGNVGVGSPSAARTFTVLNSSTASMAFTITPSAPFTETDNCASVAAGASCTINAVFTPAATGAVTGTIGISYSGFGSPLSVSVTGTGVAPVTLTPTSQAFGNVALGTTSAARIFTVTNRGTIAQALTIAASAPFSQTNSCGSSLAGGASCTISAVFAPTTAAAASSTITVSSATLALTVAVTGTGIAPVTFNPASLAFSTTQRVGVATPAQAVTIRNRATAALAIQSIVASPADYTQTNNCGASLAANATCTVNVIFNPHVTGSIPGTLTISDSALGSPQTVTLTGAGVLATIRSLAISPATASVPKGSPLQFKATATYNNGTSGDVTAISTWTSLNPVVLSIVSTSGLATGVTAGGTSVTATVTGTTAIATMAVTVLPPAIASLALSPVTASVAPGGTMAYTATATYTDATTGTPAMSALALSSDNTGIATINSSGTATGINGGVANLKAAAGAVVSAPVQLTVTGSALQSITVTPGLASILKGNTQQFTATGNYSDSTTKDLTAQVAWSSNNVDLTINAQGLATAVTPGPATVTASWSGGVVVGTTNATVLASSLVSIDVTPASISVGIGAQQQYTAVGHYNDNTTQDITNRVTWISGNTAVVGITPSGFATVLGTSTTAIPISATLGAVTSNPPAFLSALSTLPRVCPDASVDMKVLVIDNVAAGYVDMPAIKQILDFVGTPYSVMNYSDVTPAALSDGTCHGYFQGIVMAYGGDIYNGNASLYTTLNSYETTFHARQVNWRLNPTPDYGFNYYTSFIDSNGSDTANFTAAAASVFPMINTATPLKISNAYIFLSPLYTPPTGTVTPLLTDASGNVLSAIYAPGNGQEILSQTFDSNQYLTHNLVLAYGLLNWVTKGVFLGDYHVYAAAQVDDFFINDAEWVPATSCTNPTTHDRTVSDDPSLPTFRLQAADMTALVAWQNNLQNDPLLKGFKLTMAFNGVGTVGNNDWTGLPLPGVANDDLTSSVHDYEQFFHWITHTYDHPNTLDGLHKSDVGGDTDNPQVDSIDLEILTNLFVASGTTQGGVNLDVDTADNPPLGAVTPLNFTDFNPANMVSPGVTGLNDPVVPQYLYANGIRYVVSDTSVTNQPNNGPNPSPNVGIVNSYAPGIYEVPRYPNSIYYNAANWADDEAEFHCIYGPDPGPATPIYTDYKAADILNYTTDTFVVNMLKGDMDPQMFHQPNLHAYDGTNSLISDVYNQTFTKYKALYKLPVLSLTLDQLGEGMKARNAYNLAGATGTMVGVGTATPSVAITVPPANQGAVIPVTGLASNGSELYGGTPVSHIQIDPGQTVTLPLQ